MSKVYVLIINGYPLAGKDEFVKNLQTLETRDVHHKFFLSRYSSVDTVKKIATDYFGWDGSKTPEWRKRLSDMKDFFDKTFDLTIHEVRGLVGQQEATSADYRTTEVVTLMIREPDQIETIVSDLHDQYQNDEVKVITVFIDRDQGIVDHGNHADQNVECYQYDYYIDNNGTIEDLFMTTEEFVKDVIK